MESWADYSSIVHSLPFTFLVGPNHTKLTIQSGLARHVSQPLDNLMNGETRESKHHIAMLEEEDVETFVAFSEYAYTGDYNVPPPAFREDYKESAVSNPFKRMGSGGVPPPAPSPPPGSVGYPEQYTPQFPAFKSPQWDKPPADTREGFGGAEGPGDTSMDHFDLPQPLPQESSVAPEESAIAPETQSEQPPSAPAPTEEPAQEAENSNASAKGKKGKKNKKDKKKGKAGASTEDAPTNLTPPSTPPPEKPLESAAAAETAETPAADEGAPGPTVATESVDPFQNGATEGGENDEWGATAPSGTMTESWEQSAPTPPEGDTTFQQKEGEEGEEKDRDEGFERQQTQPFIDTSFAKQHFSSPREKGLSLWDEFEMIDYVDHRVPYGTRPPSPLSVLSKNTQAELPYLTFHAKVYVFATRYLIPALAQLCLRKLHRDLLYLGFPESSPEYQDEEQFVLSTIKARMVLDLMHYTYSKTTRLEPINPTSATQLRDNELRKLVTHYASCKVRDLAKYCPSIESMVPTPAGHPLSMHLDKPSAQGLRALLDTKTELASDLVYRMM